MSLGTWNSGLYSNDITCDVKDTYISFLKQQYNNEDAFVKTYDEFREMIGTEDEPLFWYALADTQWAVGRLMPKVREMAVYFIKEKGGCPLWKGSPKHILKWERVLRELCEKICSPVPPEKKFHRQVDFKHNPWNVGDIFAYQFHTKLADEHGLLGKFILFQKVGDVEYYKDRWYSVVQIFDKVFEMLPELNNLEHVRILPQVSPPGINGCPSEIRCYIPSFQWFLKATMLYEKKAHYPKKYFTFIGNKQITEVVCSGNDCTEFLLTKDGMEEWLIDFYLLWKNVEY
jgi:hypothetical protein